ncbi:MAG: hypothetical protein EA369_08120 [Bradymonadales bacterium]|nr:MAG: hypothetical protein EA369_08120 [Bradymonadales bacterium]
MNQWRLSIRTLEGLSQDFDLSRQGQVFAGDDTANDVCIQSVSIPSRHPIVRIKRGKPVINLSEEVRSSLTGNFQKNKDWNSKLYQGSEFIASGDCRWTVENIEFSLEKVLPLTLSKERLSNDPLAQKSWRDSFGISFGFHLSLFLMIFSLQWLWSLFQTQDEALDIQAISLVQIEEIFKPEPTPVEQEPKPVELDTPKPQAERPQTTARRSVAAPPRTQQQAAGQAASGESRKQDLQSMGLLALQATPQSDSSRTAIDRARVTDASSDESARGVSVQRASLGVEVQTGRQSLASLSGLSSGAYVAGDIGSDLDGQASANLRLIRREVEVRGGLDPALVQQIIEERLTQVRRCYESALRNEPGLAGKIETSWTINADGRVSNLKMNSQDLTQASLQQCIHERIASWNFPEPRGGGIVNVKYPFVFSPLGS